MEESNEQTDRQEADDLESFAKSVIRRPTKGSWESLLAQHLIQSVNAPALQKLRLICEAAFMAEDKAKGLDMELLDVTYQVTTGLQQTKDKEWIWIPWPFDPSKNNYDRYIKPWRRQSTRYFRFNSTCHAESDDKEKRLHELKGNKAAEFFYWTDGIHLSGSTFQVLVSEFTRWALPRMMMVFSELSKLVDPELYQSILYAFSGRKQREETE